MHYVPVVDRFPIVPALDPLALAVFAATFVALALATARRAAFGCAALAFAAPFAFAHAVAGTTISFPKVVLLGVAVGLASHRNAAAPLRDRSVRAMLVAFACVIGAIACTVAVAAHRSDALRECAKWIEYALLFLATAAAYRLDPDAKLLRRAWTASIVLVCASALVQEFLGAPWGIAFGPGVAPRIAGVIEGPNQLAGYLETALALLAVWAVVAPSRLRAFLLGIAAFTLALTFSRAGIAASLVAVSTVVWCERAQAAAVLAPYLTGLAAGLAADVGWMLAARSLPLLRSVDLHGDYAGGVGHRGELWRAAFFFFRHHPILGIGAGNYELELADAGVFGVRTHANSWYLQALAEGGIVLFAATLAFLATTLATLRARLSVSPWALAAFAATLALALHQTIDYLVFYPKVAEPWIVLIALGIASPRAD